MPSGWSIALKTEERYFRVVLWIGTGLVVVLLCSVSYRKPGG